MQRQTKIALVIIILTISIAYIVNIDADIVDKIVAVVNDELITQSDVEDYIKPYLENYRSFYSGDELELKIKELRNATIQKLINDKIILGQAERLKIEIKPLAIERRLNGLKESFESEDEFIRSLEYEGISLRELRERFGTQIKIENVIEHEIKSKITITPTEFLEFYNSHLEDYTIKERASVKHIFINFSQVQDGEQKQEIEVGYKDIALKKANEVLQLLKQGVEFSEIARSYSDSVTAKDGGEMGIIERGDLKEDFDRVIFSLKPGEVSEILEDHNGYHIFYVTEWFTQDTKKLEEVRQDIENTLYRAKFGELFDVWIEDLRRDAYISIKY